MQCDSLGWEKVYQIAENGKHFKFWLKADFSFQQSRFYFHPYFLWTCNLTILLCPYFKKSHLWVPQFSQLCFIRGNGKTKKTCNKSKKSEMLAGLITLKWNNSLPKYQNKNLCTFCFDNAKKIKLKVNRIITNIVIKLYKKNLNCWQISFSTTKWRISNFPWYLAN